MLYSINDIQKRLKFQRSTTASKFNPWMHAKCSLQRYVFLVRQSVLCKGMYFQFNSLIFRMNPIYILELKFIYISHVEMGRSLI